MLSHLGYGYRLPQIRYLGKYGKYGKSTLHTGISIVQTASDGRLMVFYSYFWKFKSDRDVFNDFGNFSPLVDKGNRQDCCHIRHHINYSIALTYYRFIIQTVLHRSRAKPRFIQLSSSRPKLEKT